MNLEKLYQLRRQSVDKKSGANSIDLLTQTHWFTSKANFDPKTGNALPQSLAAFLTKVAQSATTEPLRDRLWRITDHARPSVERLLRALNESPRREQALLPIHAVRELDANSFIKLSNRPGRNIREKLSGKPYLQAVRRFQSANLPENRLLKSFITRLAELLELRRDCLGEEEDDLLPKTQSWLRSDEAKTIANWDNLPPNNTLLSHRDYRRVWDAWRWLQTLDDDIARDFSQLESREEIMRKWNEYGRMYYDETYRFAEMPVLFNYEKFEISPWVSQLAFQKTMQKIARRIDTNEFSEPACVDLSVLRPRYATTRASSTYLHESYLWQQWKNADESVEIELFNSDAAYLHPDTTSISSTDLFFSKDNTHEYLDRAARAFASKLRDTFKNDTLIWLVPDFLNDFEVEITRRNINARFPDAMPLPRSVAAVFEQVDYSKITRDGFSVVVVDHIGGKICATKLIARFDPELKSLLPETDGFYWERCPPVIISHRDTASVERKELQNYDILTVDGKGQWRDAVRPERLKFLNQNTLKHDLRIGQFEVCINLTNSPVNGGMRLHALQSQAGDIPLWRDQIPELSIKVIKNGRYQRFYLVSRGTTVKPIRSVFVTIPVQENFTLPAGRAFYQFPLFQGENADELGFSARLDSPAFPLKTDTVCELNLSFEYGADEPYKLVFTPLNKSFPPIRATWQRTEEVIITDAPAPEYPTPMTWVELRRVPKSDGGKTSDLLDWIVNGIKQLDKELFRTTGKIMRSWRVNPDGAHYTSVRCDDSDRVFIHERNFAEGFSYKDFNVGDELSFALQEGERGHSGRKVAGADYKEPPRSLIESIHKRLYFPIIQAWRDGRSISDAGCPSEFTDAMRVKIKYLASLLQHDGIPNLVQREVVFLLACMHKDMPDECIQWITEQVENGSIRDVQAVGFALGDVSEQWQEYALSKLVAHQEEDALRVFAYAIWREQHFVEKFKFAELQTMLAVLHKLLMSTARSVAWPLELLLGLLRIRASANPEIRMLLQPHQKITKELAKQVERVTEIFAKSNVTLFSRVQINLPQRPEGDRTPDLLYALRLYLTGDDGANAIHITSISDSNND